MPFDQMSHGQISGDQISSSQMTLGQISHGQIFISWSNKNEHDPEPNIYSTYAEKIL